MGKPEKITPTREAVLDAFAEGRTFAYRPLGITDIARNIAEARDAWQEPFTVMSRATLVRVLKEMTDDGTLVVRTGSQWMDEGVGFRDRRPDSRYWATRERAEGWARKREEEEREAKARDRQERAEKLAMAKLKELHHTEYADLVNQYLAAYDRVSAESPELFEKR